MYNRWIYGRINNLVEKYHTRNPGEFLNLLRIRLHYIDSPSRLLGVYQVILRNRVILITSNIGGSRKIVLAHEIGHDQLHRQYCIDGHAFHKNKVFSPTDVFESEVNIFAAHLLISGKDLIKTMHEYTDDKTMAYKLGVDINLLNLRISEMVELNKFPTDVYYTENPKSTFLGDYSPLDDE